MNNWLLSYPRSGSHLLRYFIELMTQRPTLGCRGNPQDTPICKRRGIKLLKDVSKQNPIAQKAHWVSEMSLSPQDGLIMIIRYPIDALISEKLVKREHNDPREVHKFDDLLISEIRKEILRYNENLNLYESFLGKKCIVKYEDLVSNNSYLDALVVVADFFEIDKKTVDRIATNYHAYWCDSLEGPIRACQSSSKNSKHEFSRSKELKARDPATHDQLMRLSESLLKHSIIKALYPSTLDY